jgi:phosphoglucomutase
MMKTDPHAGQLESPEEVLDVSALIKAFFDKKPDPAIPAQKVSFGTSGHRGSAFDTTFNENHILAITQAICRFRAAAGIKGPLFMGYDTHAVSQPAFRVALEVLAANGVSTMVDQEGGFTPTPVISHAILTYNRGRTEGLADGIVITPSHNPPRDGGFKYNPPNGGPADSKITDWIEKTANSLLADQLKDVKRLATPAGAIASVIQHPYRRRYTEDLTNVVAVERIAAAGIRIGVDPLGGAATRYWEPLAQHYGLALTVTDPVIDPTFKSIPRDWDGKIRMDCSSPYPMSRLLSRRQDFDIAFANDTDADRHGIVTPAGLMPPNDYLAACILYLGRERKFAHAKVGKTVVSSSMIDRAAHMLGAGLFEVPVGFKWFVDGLLRVDLFFSGEESAGSSFLRRDGSVWTTDKDGLIAGLLAAEMLAVSGNTPDIFFDHALRSEGAMYYERQDNPANAAVKAALAGFDPKKLHGELAGAPIRQVMTKAPGNEASIGGVKIVTDKGWVAARPSGTEDIVKLYAESFVSKSHLADLQAEGSRALSLDV